MGSTTLKAFGTLGLGDLEGSQPYDGVYEPFDFATRNAVVQGGVVKPAAIVTTEAWSEEIKGAAVATNHVVELDAGETQDTATDETDQTDVDESAAPGNLETMTVGKTAAREVARVYAACARRLIGRIVKMTPWFVHLENMSTRGRSGARNKSSQT